MNIPAILAVLTVSVITSGCIKKSIEFPTDDFIKETTILSYEDETFVTTILRRADEFPYILHESDTLTSDYNGDIKSMTRSNTNAYYQDDNITFSLSSTIGSKQAFSSKYEGDLVGQEILVSFNRAEAMNYQSSVSIPEASNILSPATTDAFYFDFDQNVIVTWDNQSSSSQTISLNFQTECSEHSITYTTDRVIDSIFHPGSKETNVTVPVDDTGTATISMLDILDIRSDYDLYQTDIENGVVTAFEVNELDCQTELFITRENEGNVDQGFNENSKITAKTSRKMPGSFQILLEQP